MKIDYHVHLEEGPYNLSWLNKANGKLAPIFLEKSGLIPGTKEAIIAHTEQFLRYLKEGPFTENFFDHYLKSAKEKGLKQVGLVDHLYRFKETRAYFDQFVIVDDTPLGKEQRYFFDTIMIEEMDVFIAFVQSQKEKWKQEGIELRLGIEADYFVGGEEMLRPWLEEKPWDFVIGSVHFNKGWGFDNPDTIDRYNDLDLLALYKDHFHTVEKLIQSGLFDFVAHLDNLKVFNFRPNEDELISMYEKIGDLLMQHNMATELSTGLKYRYPIQECCPSPTFLEVLVKKGVPFTLSSDAHFAVDLGMLIPEAVQQLKDLGVTEIATFKNRKRIMLPIE